MIDIINAYSAAGYGCVLLTGRLNKRNTPLHHTAILERIVRYNRTTTFGRLWTWIIGFLQIWLKVVFKFRKDYLFIVSNPPLATLLPLFVKNRFQLLIFDVYPDALSELGYLPDNSLILKWWRNANKKVFKKAESIFTITESMKQLLQTYTDKKIIEVVSVWTDNHFLKPIDPSENSFLKKHNLTGKFVVLYSGNIGLSGDVEVLIDIAGKIKRNDIVFLIIGDGAKKTKIHEEVDKRQLTNVMLLPWQPGTELPFSLSAASIAVVSIGTKASKLAVPSKLYNFLSVGAPILCVTAKGSEVENLVAKYECGRSFEPNDIVGMTNFIIEVADNKELQNILRKNSLKASNDFNISDTDIFLASLRSDQEKQ